MLGFTVGGMLSVEAVAAAGWGVVGFSGGVLVLWGACGICCLGWFVLGAVLVLVVEGFDGLVLVVGSCGDGGFETIGLRRPVGVEDDVVGLAAGVLFVLEVVIVAGLGMVGNGLGDVAAAVWFVLVLSRRRLSAKASRKLFMCLWEKYHGLVGANAECCCACEQATVIFVGLLWEVCGFSCLPFCVFESWCGSKEATQFL